MSGISVVDNQLVLDLPADAPEYVEVNTELLRMIVDELNRWRRAIREAQAAAPQPAPSRDGSSAIRIG